jgi:hypothetical protein
MKRSIYCVELESCCVAVVRAYNEREAAALCCDSEGYIDSYAYEDVVTIINDMFELNPNEFKYYSEGDRRKIAHEHLGDLIRDNDDVWEKIRANFSIKKIDEDKDIVFSIYFSEY